MRDLSARSGPHGTEGEDQQGSVIVREDEGGEREGSAPTFHDPWLQPSGPALKFLSTDIAARIERQAPGRTRHDAAERRSLCAANIMANLALLSLGPESSPNRLLAVSTEKRKPSRYDRAEFPRRPLAGVLEAMEGEGLILRRPYVFKQQHTTVAPTPELATLLQRNGVSTADIGRAPGGETIWLAARTGRPAFGPEAPSKTLVLYADTEESIRFRAEMERINAFLSRADIRFTGQRQPPAHLRRNFILRSLADVPSFHLSGRLHGGFWQDVSSRQRHLLSLDGEPVADLDFVAMFAQLAYLRAGGGLPGAEPYEVPGLEDHRGAAKLGLLSLLSRPSDMRRLSPELKAALPEGWTARHLSEAMAARHPRIAHLFGTDIGVDLMFTESQLLVALLLRLASRGIPALPMHDGIMVAASAAEAARRGMEEAAREVVGVALPVKNKAIWRPDERAAA